MSTSTYECKVHFLKNGHGLSVRFTPRSSSSPPVDLASSSTTPTAVAADSSVSPPATTNPFLKMGVPKKFSPFSVDSLLSHKSAAAGTSQKSHQQVKSESAAVGSTDAMTKFLLNNNLFSQDNSGCEINKEGSKKSTSLFRYSRYVHMSKLTLILAAGITSRNLCRT